MWIMIKEILFSIWLVSMTFYFYRKQDICATILISTIFILQHMRLHVDRIERFLKRQKELEDNGKN